MDVLHYKYYGLSEKGLRPNNEDAVLTLKLDDHTFFFAVADGMGGVKGGEIASNLVMQKIMESLEQQSLNGGFSSGKLKELLSGLFEKAQLEIKDYVESHDEYKGMGTTLTALFIHKDTYAWGSIGDCRIYCATRNDVVRFTHDHNLLEDPGYHASKEELAGMPEQYLHALTRVVDGGDSRPDIFPADEPWFRMKKGTTWILCSDGLIIDKQEEYGQLLLRFANRIKEPERLAKSLVRQAMEKGSSDNISVVVVKVTEEEMHEEVEYHNNAPTQKIFLPQHDETSTNPTKKNRLWIIILILVIMVLIIIFLNQYFDLNWLPFDWRTLFGDMIISKINIG